MSVYEETIAKIRQLPEPLVHQVNYFVEFLLMKSGSPHAALGTQSTKATEIAESAVSDSLLDLETQKNDFSQLRTVLNLAREETKQMMEMGVDISDPLVITPLGWTANKYPEIAEYCNELLTELIEKQISNPSLEVEDKTMTGEF